MIDDTQNYFIHDKEFYKILLRITEWDRVNKGDKKCIVKDCRNRVSQGNFVGDLCAPCHEFLTENTGRYSQAYRNALKIVTKELVDFELDPREFYKWLSSKEDNHKKL